MIIPSYPHPILTLSSPYPHPIPTLSQPYYPHYCVSSCELQLIRNIATTNSIIYFHPDDGLVDFDASGYGFLVFSLIIHVLSLHWM